MATRTHPGLYTFGAVELDSSPSVNLFAQIMARREAHDKAKNDAFDDYIRGLNTKINPAGTRVADLDAFNAKKTKWVEFGLTNKDKLMKNDIPTQTEFNRLYQEALNIPIESKAAEEQKKPFVEIITDPNKRKQLSSNVFKAIGVHDEPLYNKDEKTGEYVRNYNRKPIDYTGKIFNPQFDFNKGYEGWAKDMDRSETIGEVVSRDNVTGRANVSFTKAYTPEQVKQISMNAARSAEAGGENNEYYQLRYEKIYQNPEEAKKLNEAFQSVYGKEIKLLNGQTIPNYIDSPEEVAAADAILQAQSMSEKGTKAASDFDLKNQAAINKIYIQDNLIRNRRTGGIDGEGDFDIVGNYSRDAEKVTVKVNVGKGMFPKYEEKTEYRVYADNIPEYHDKYLGGIAPKVDPNTNKKYYKLLPNNDWEGKNGTVKRKTVEQAYRDANTSLSKRTGLSEDDNNNQTRPPKNIAETKMAPNTGTYQIKGKKYTEADLIKMGYTKEQIAPYKNK